MSDSIVPAGSFAALTPAEDGMALQDIVNINMGGSGVDPSMLDRVKVPSGGSLAWEVPGVDGEPEPTKEIIGVLVGVKNVRSYYETEYSGGNEAPDCASEDGITGTPREPGCGYGGQCSVCPKSQWGSGENGGQACSQRKLLLVLQPDSMLPLVVNVPPSSLREVDKYLLRLTAKKMPFFYCVTSLKLAKEKNKGGIEYAKIAPGFVRLLEDDEKASAFAMFRGLSAVFNQVAADSVEEPF